MQDGKSRDECVRLLHSHLASTSTNEELAHLQVQGTNVYESEKAHAMCLIEKARTSSLTPGQEGNFKLLWVKQPEEIT